MSKKYTPVLAIASSGLLQGHGIGIAGNLTAAVNGFNSSALAAQCQYILSATNNTNVHAVLNNIADCITGVVPESLSSTVPAGLVSQFHYNNLIADVAIQANLAVANGVTGLTSLLSQALTQCTNSYELLGTYGKMQTGSYSDFGFTINNYKDIVTGGVNSQFAAIPGGTSSTEFKALANQFQNFGTMYDVTRLGSLDDPRVLCQNLLNQGFLLISEILTANAIDVTNLSTADRAHVLDVLSTIRGIELDAIVSVTNFVPSKSITSLADVLNANNVLSTAALVAAGGSLAELSRKLTNIGGRFNSFAELKDLFSSIQQSTTPSLHAQATLGPSSLFANTIPRLGTGTGIFGNPTMYDLLGAVAGYGYVDDINSIVSIHGQLIATTPGQTLFAALATLRNNLTSSAALNTVAVAYNDMAAASATLIQAGQAKFAAIFNRLLQERKNLNTLNIDLTQSIVENNSIVMTFVDSLHSVYSDPMLLHYGELINRLVTNDVYGEAIAAAIVEGKNIATLNNYGIPSYTKIDPMEYAVAVAAAANC
jgi:hypothetical protein